jgi:hypothetical protein
MAKSDATVGDDVSSTAGTVVPVTVERDPRGTNDASSLAVPRYQTVLVSNPIASSLAFRASGDISRGGTDASEYLSSLLASVKASWGMEDLRRERWEEASERRAPSLSVGSLPRSRGSTSKSAASKYPT